MNPDPDAYDLGQWMLESTDVEDRILLETIESAERGDLTESGRTVCNRSNISDPIDRFPRAVDLRSCPITQSAGIWHTHVTMDQIKNPDHSLPDWANVIYGQADASIIPGVETTQVVYAPEDYDAAQAAFENAVGAEFSSADDVASAVTNGNINPVTARRRVEDALSSIAERYDTYRPELLEYATDAPIGASVPARTPISASGCAAYDTRFKTGQRPTVSVSGLTHSAEVTNALSSYISDSTIAVKESDQLNVNIGEIVIGTAIGTIVSTIVERIVFD